MDDIPNIPTDESSAYDRYSSNEAYYTELMSFLSESNSMRDTAKSAVKQSLYAASGAFTGSFIAGPVGGLIGGITGSIIGYAKSDNFDGAIVALTKLEASRQKVRNAAYFIVVTICIAVYRWVPCSVYLLK
jgi:uncharacterized membrane protein